MNLEDELTDIRIYKTYNYDQFFLLPENRNVTGKLVGKSIDKKDLLMDNSILVKEIDGKKYVYDGQNRLKEARKRGIAIYYRYAQITERKDIGLIQNQTNWNIGNRTHFFQDNPEYQFVSQIEKKFGLRQHFVVECCDPSTNAKQKYNNGDFIVKGDRDLLIAKFTQFAALIRVIEKLTKQTKEKYKINHKFQLAIWSFMDRKDYCQKRMLHALRTHSENTLEALTYNSKTRVYSILEHRIFYFYIENNKRII